MGSRHKTLLSSIVYFAGGVQPGGPFLHDRTVSAPIGALDRSWFRWDVKAPSNLSSRRGSSGDRSAHIGEGPASASDFYPQAFHSPTNRIHAFHRWKPIGFNRWETHYEGH
jgi:hypothetical protein